MTDAADPASPVSPAESAAYGAHRLCVRVYYEDTDAGGVVYHARYLAFAERARTELLRERGASHEQLSREHGLILVVRNLEVEYGRPARLDDLLAVDTRVRRLGGASALLDQEIRRDGALLAALRVGLACVRRSDGRPQRLPARWRALLGPQGPAGTADGGGG